MLHSMSSNDFAFVVFAWSMFVLTYALYFHSLYNSDEYHDEVWRATTGREPAVEAYRDPHEG